MKSLNIYIASSWKNRAAVEMLTEHLRGLNHTVFSFVENNFLEGHDPDKSFDFEEWVKTESAEKCFEFDSEAAGNSDLVIYVSPSGKDAAAECGIAYGSGVPIFGLYAKGEDFGLMRKIIDQWFTDFRELLIAVNEFSPINLNSNVVPLAISRIEFDSPME